MDPADMQAFARAQQLLSRKEDLAELPPMAPLASMQADGSPKRRSTKPAAAPQPAAARRRPAPQKEFALPAHHGPLPSLSQLATESVGQELQFLQKPNPTSRRPLRPRAPPEESRRAALSAIDTAMPSLDDDSAQLIARARALIDGSAGAATAEGLTQAPGRPGGTSSATLQRRQRRPASSARLQTLPERTGSAAASAAGGGAAAAARIRTAPPQSAPAYEPVARYGGADARAAAHHEEMRERARERVRQARLASQQQEVEAEMAAVSRQAGALSRDTAKVERFRADVERRLAAKLREQKRQAQESAREQMEMAAAQRARQQEQAAQEQAVRRALQRKQQAAQQQGEP